MTFQESLEQIQATIREHGDKLVNEEMTKQALILPMIEAWGYDTRNPSEVMAEYPVSMPNGGIGRADYVIMHDERPAIIIECKAAGVVVDQRVSDQMQDYASALGVAIGVATNGIGYSCFADVETAGKMDDGPYCFINIAQLTEDDERALLLLSKASLLLGNAREAALGHKQELEVQGRADAFVWAPSTRGELFRLAELRDESERDVEIDGLVEKIAQQLRSAVAWIALEGSTKDSEDGIETTDEEYDAYSIVKGILHGVIEPGRVDFRDLRTYASVLIDNNNRKPICRLHFSGRQKYLGTFDAERKETRHSIDGVNDIVAHAAALRRTARQYSEG